MRQKTLDRLREELPSLMRAWAPCDNDSDYKCAFCHERSNTNLGDITHTKDCLGEELLKDLANDPFSSDNLAAIINRHTVLKL